ncbi:outer membrane protein, putative [Ichthyophthirius multifiliis]|uniref:Outer membrane protein, putative n=1 Tax=Ichthyophthirius multifiliis TaxID=5932 RepID=G0QSV6_ICHMU|nr:outer membrane protein, putative [Ichthyophthirius multifiliis]EGR31699.1 outer membrane protein, putative [Ichthyophthirius multifiliis]|eukprot:XP_004035185.1 outer membrane protein, putative [Ichthyophthirius multifiliis]
MTDPLEIDENASVSIRSSQKNNEVVNKVLEELKKDDKLTITTSGFSIENNYKNVENTTTKKLERQKLGYKVKNQIQVKSSELEKAEEVIQTAIENGFNTVDFVKYYPDNEQIQKAYNDLIVEAVKDAQKKAEIILKGVQYSVDISYKNTDKDVQAALKKNKEVVKKVLDIYKKDGQLSVSSTGFNIDSDNYDFKMNEETEKNERVFEGYKVKNSILIKSSNSQKAGKVIDDAINNEFNSVDFVNFYPDDEQMQQAREKLLYEAVQDARKKLNLLIKNLGQEVIGVKRIYDIYEDINSPNSNSMTYALGGDTSIQLNKSKKTMTIKVRVQFFTQPISENQ